MPEATLHMRLYFLKRPLTSTSGIVVVLLYCLFTFTSWGLYPHPFSPLTNYLSRLGDLAYSPFGGYFYNTGCILTGAALIPFFIGLHQWHTKAMLGRILLITGQAIGVCSAVALIMIGVFSEDKGQPHMLASSTFFELMFVALILASIALLLHPKFLKLIGLYGIAIALSDLVFSFKVGGPLVEWYAVFSALAFVAFVAVNTLKLAKSET